MSSPRKLSRCRVSAAPAALALALTGAVLVAPGSASAGPTSAPQTTARTAHVATTRTAVAHRVTGAGNPLANLSWGHETGYVNDGVYPAYQQARGTNRALLAKIALRPRAHWFGPWNTNAQIYKKMSDYIADVTKGEPNVLVQMAIFRLVPWEGAACRRASTSAEAASYKQWIDRAARAIGSTHVALILQPDLPFALCVPKNRSVPEGLVAYAAKKFSSLPHTSVYLDAGAADWFSVAHIVGLLKASGVRYARGFALNATHYDSTTHQIAFGAQVSKGLYNAGIKGKHFVVNTAENGRPFTYQWWHPRHPKSDYNNIAPCSSRTQTRCPTLGIPPTWHVDSTSTKLSATSRALAARLVDGYLWFGRPWLEGTQFSPTKTFNLKRTLAIARTTPY